MLENQPPMVEKKEGPVKTNVASTTDYPGHRAPEPSTADGSRRHLANRAVCPNRLWPRGRCLSRGSSRQPVPSSRRISSQHAGRHSERTGRSSDFHVPHPPRRHPHRRGRSRLRPRHSGRVAPRRAGQPGWSVPPPPLRACGGGGAQWAGMENF